VVGSCPPGQVVEQAGQLDARCTGFWTTWVPTPRLRTMHALVDELLNARRVSRRDHVSLWPIQFVLGTCRHRGEFTRRGSPLRSLCRVVIQRDRA